MPIDRGMDKDVVHKYTMKYYTVIKKKNQNNAICSNMDGPRVCHTERSKSEKDKHDMILLIRGT